MHAMSNKMTMAAVTAAMAATLAACSGGNGGEPASGTQQQPGYRAPALDIPVPECIVDGDCPDGTGCAASAGACVAFAEEGQVFSVLVNPLGDDGLLPFQYGGVAVGAGGRLDLAVDEPIEVGGVVVFGQDGPDISAVDPAGNPRAISNSGTLGGYLVATAEGVIPGTLLRSEAYVQPKQNAGDENTYTIDLLPDVFYEMTFIPDYGDNDLPAIPLYVVGAKFSKSARFDIVLPSRHDYLDSRLTGVVVLEDDGKTPVEGALVSGVSQDGSPGTNAVTDAKGVFTIVMPPGHGAVSLHVGPGDGSPVFPARDFHYKDGLSALVGQATPKFVVGPVPPVREIILQVVNVSEGNLIPVGQARVEARGKAAGGSVFGQGTTEDDGLVHLDLLEGLYALTVMPPSDSRFASKQMVLDLEDKKDESVFVVPLGMRSKISGLVAREGSGEGVPSALVTFQTNMVNAFEGAEQGVQDFSVDAVTNADGTFEAWVDPGFYALTVVPPAWSGLARFSQPSVDLTGGDSSMKVFIPEAALVRGKVTRATDGSSVIDARVQFYFNAPADEGAGLWALDQTSFAASVQLAGSTSVDADGVFSMVVPTLSLDGDVIGSGPGTGNWSDGGGSGKAESAYGLPAVDVEPIPSDQP